MFKNLNCLIGITNSDHLVFFGIPSSTKTSKSKYLQELTAYGEVSFYF